MHRTLLILIALGQSLLAQAPASRGIWWWTSPGHAWGTEAVIGDATKEAAVLAFAKQWDIGQFYCCFGKATRANPELIRAWNERAHGAGKSSQLLLSENTWIFPDKRSNLLTQHIQHGLVEFNAATTNPQQRFDALHLDIEPQGLPAWKTMTPTQRRDTLLLLRDTFRDVRAYLDAHGAKELPVYADLWLQKSSPFEAINHALEESLDDATVPAGRAGKLARTTVKGVGMLGAQL